LTKDKNLTPKEVVTYLDKYIIGQKEAKKAIALALRNRYRRMLLDEKMRDEIMPKNILMIGQTGVGKTEIARRMAKMLSLPFVKVEASKFTEVGFVGRDVESMIRDLVLASFNIVKKEQEKEQEKEIQKYITSKIATTIIPPLPSVATDKKKENWQKSIATMEKKILDGAMDDTIIEIQIEKKAPSFNNNDLSPDISNIQDTISKMVFSSKKENVKKNISIKEAKTLLRNEAIDNIIDENSIASLALQKAQNGGIIFIDEIDKVVSSNSNRNDPSKDGVQRDLLPIVEGSSVHTKYGQIQTDHILFISAGAFHVSKPSDLIPELQGRFPIRVELESLSEDILYKILTKTQNSLLKQYQMLLKVDNVNIKFEDKAIKSIAKLTHKANLKADNIGARRLHTVLEKILEDISFDFGKYQKDEVKITSKMVHSKLDLLVEDEDITRYIL